MRGDDESRSQDFGGVPGDRSGSALLAGCSSYDKPAQTAEVHCAGINACKGQSACKTANSSCKGLNACKGQGWLPTASAAECTAAGGTVL